jgi:hypothetical protein
VPLRSEGGGRAAERRESRFGGARFSLAHVDAASVAVVVSAFGVGGLAGGLLRAEHERTERFRERMIDAAEQFLEAVGRARDAVREARTVSEDPEADGTLHELRFANVQTAAQAIEALDPFIVRLSLIFPSLRRRAPVFNAAGEIQLELRSELDLITEEGPWTETRSEAWHSLEVSPEYQIGFFAGNANQQIWRRWFFTSGPGQTTLDERPNEARDTDRDPDGPST